MVHNQWTILKIYILRQTLIVAVGGFRTTYYGVCEALYVILG